MRRLVLVLGLCTLLPAAPGSAASTRSGAGAWCGTARSGARDAVWAHREQRDRRGAEARSLHAAYDVGQIAVLMDEGDLALVANAMDLQKAGVHSRPQAAATRYRAWTFPWSPTAGCA